MKLYFIPVLLLLASCANMGNLSGGDPDTQAPLIKTSNLSQTNFNKNEIIIEFDEFISLNNSEKNIRIMPEHSRLSCSISKKKLIIKIDTLLQHNTTYQLLINNGVQDVNANNSFSYSYVFSTGDQIDTGRILFKLKGVQDVKNLKLCLSESSGKDSFKNFTSDYVYDVSADSYEFKGLSHSRSFNAWLFTDINLDNKPDAYQPINFIKTVKIDSSYTLQLNQWMKPFEILKIKTDLKYDIIYYTHLKSHQIELSNVLNVPKKNILYSSEDSAIVIHGDYQSKTIDTVSNLPIHSLLNSIVLNSVQLIQFKKYYLLNYYLPEFYNKDSHSLNTNYQSLQSREKPDSILLKSTTRTDTLKLNELPVLDASKLSYLNIEIQDSASSLYDIIISKDSKPFLYLSGVKNYSSFVGPGTYEIEIVPYNSMYFFNPFTMRESNPVLYKKTFILKASWEEILQIKL